MENYSNEEIDVLFCTSVFIASFKKAEKLFFKRRQSDEEKKTELAKEDQDKRWEQRINSTTSS